MAKLTLFPPAKINIGLIILGKLPSGYHLLETLLVPVPQLTDRLELSISPEPGCDFFISGIPIEGQASDNLCVKAYRLLEEAVGGLPGVRIRLSKGIPAGAGLGGGSADAAYTLRGLNELLNLDLPLPRLHELAARLGADVPFFLYDEPMLATGVGTDLTPYPLKLPCQVRIQTPAIHSATAAAYQGLNLALCDPNRSLQTMLTTPLERWRHTLVNDLEEPVFRRFPELAQLKAQQYEAGAVYAAMSGSGSAVFGLFPE